MFFDHRLHDRDNVHAQSSSNSGDSTLVPAFLIARSASARLTFDSDLVQVDRASWSDSWRSIFFGDPNTAIGTAEASRTQGFPASGRGRCGHSKGCQKWAAAHSVQFLSVILSMCAVIGYGGVKVLAGALSVGRGLVAFYSFIIQLFEPSMVPPNYTQGTKDLCSIRQNPGRVCLDPKC